MDPGIITFPSNRSVASAQGVLEKHPNLGPFFDHFFAHFLTPLGLHFRLQIRFERDPKSCPVSNPLPTPSRSIFYEFPTPKLSTFQDNSSQKRHSPLIASRRQDHCKNHSFCSSKPLLAHHLFTQNWSPRGPTNNIKTTSCPNHLFKIFDPRRTLIWDQISFKID